MTDTAPKDASAEDILKQAQGLLDANQLDKARDFLDRALVTFPARADFHQLLGVTLAKSGEREKAAAAFEKSISLDAGFIRSYFGLVMVLLEQNDFERAEKYCRAALETDENCIPFYALLGRSLMMRGKLEEAISALETAIEKDDQDASLRGNLAHLLIEIDRKDDAKEILERALELDPLNMEYHQMMALCRRYETQEDPHFQTLRELLTREDIKGRSKASLHFTLGSVYEGIGNYETSFKHYTKANDLAQALTPYNHGDTRAVFAQIKKACGPAFFEKYKNAGLSDDAPIFIIGMPRSGTSLAEQILASHSGVFGAGELKILSQLQKEFLNLDKSGDYAADVNALDTGQIRDTAALYLRQLRQYAPQANHIIDKMPQNFMFTGFIHVMFPRAKIIHCRRERRDILFSNFKTDFKEDLPFSFSFDDLNNYCDAYDDLMQHWHKTLPGKIFDFDYEDLIADQKDMTRALLDYCALDFEQACLAFHKTKRRVATASMTQVQQPLYKSALGYWRKYADFLPEEYFGQKS